MILHTDNLSALAGLSAARLNQSATGESTLELDFECHVPTRREDSGGWLDYDEPVTVMHAGRPLYHGKVTGYERSATPDGVSTRVTVTDMWALFEKASLGAQVAELEASISDTHEAPNFEQWAQERGLLDILRGPDEGDEMTYTKKWRAAAYEYSQSLEDTANEQLESWEKLAESFSLAAPGWAVNENGEILADAALMMDCKRAHYSTCGRWSKAGMLSPWAALQKMREANPDCFYIARPDGVLEVVSLAEADSMTIRSGYPHKTLAVEGISPRFSEAWAGVALLVSLPDGSVLTHTWPEGIGMEESNVKVFTASGGTTGLNILRAQVEAWWNATNELQYEGSVRVAMSELIESPLGRKLNLSGRSMPAEWENMQAIVGAVEWDFVARQVTLTLGVSIADPDLIELASPPEVEQVESERSSSEPSSEKASARPEMSSASSSSSSELSWDLPSKREDSSESSSSSSSEAPPAELPPLTDEVSESQKIYNAILQLAFFGQGNDKTMPSYYLPEIFPDWFDGSMNMHELFEKVEELTGK